MNDLDNSDIISMLATAVALIALFATIWQARIARRHNRLSVKPHLDWFRERTPGRNPSIRIVNHGLGPAIIESVHIEFCGQSFQVLGPELSSSLQTAIDEAPFFTEWDIFTPETPVKVGQEMTLFECSVEKDGSELNHSKAVALLDAVGVIVQYRSMYKEKDRLYCRPESKTAKAPVQGEAFQETHPK